MSQQNQDDLLINWGKNYRRAVREMNESNELGITKRTEQEISAKASEIADEKNRQQLDMDKDQQEPVLEKEKSIDEMLQETRERQAELDAKQDLNQEQRADKPLFKKPDQEQSFDELVQENVDPKVIEKVRQEALEREEHERKLEAKRNLNREM